jgi:predicted nucleic acid-binding protein
MSRVFWETVLFVYLLEGSSLHKARMKQLLRRSRDRGDSFYTSQLALGELLAGADRSGGPTAGKVIRETLDEIGFTYLPFDAGAVDTFRRLRSDEKLKLADAIHLACAASAGIDLFLTGDRRLTKLFVPGIQFIADFNNRIL